MLLKRMRKLGENFHFSSLFYQISRKKAMEILRAPHGGDLRFLRIFTRRANRKAERAHSFRAARAARPARMHASFVYWC
jgi:hypothetical protein